MKQETLSQILEDQAGKKAVALVTDMEAGDQTLVYREASPPDAPLSTACKSVADETV